MKYIYQVYNATGRLIFGMSLPLFRLLIRRTTRSYVLVSKGGRFLFIRSWLGRQDWQLPGGGLKKRENPAWAAARELHEEVGIKLDPADFKLLKRAVWSTDNLGHNYYIFSADCPPETTLKLQGPEIIAAQWLPPTALNSQNSPPEILDAVRLRS